MTYQTLDGPASDGTRARRPGRTLLPLLGVTLTALGGAFLLSAVSPIRPADPVASVAPSSMAESVRFDRLVRPQRAASTQTHPSAPDRDRSSRVRPAQISVPPAANQADFVPTPPLPAAAPAAVRARPAREPARDGARETDGERTAEDMVAAVQYHKLD